MSEDGKRVLAVVYVAEAPKSMEMPTPREKTIILAFKDDAIHPAYDVVVVGQELLVKVEDGRPHNLSCSAPGYTEPSATESDKSGKIFRRVFDSPLPLVSLTCGVHRSELATITVAPSTLFAFPDAEGKYRMADTFKKGRYLLRAVSPKYGSVAKELIIPENNQVNKLDFEFKE